MRPAESLDAEPAAPLLDAQASAASQCGDLHCGGERLPQCKRVDHGFGTA